MKHRTLHHSHLTFTSVALSSVNTGTVFISRKGKPYVVRERDSSQLRKVLITFSVLHTTCFFTS